MNKADLTIIAMCAILLTSCYTARQCNYHCPCISENKDSIAYTEKETIKYDTVTIEVPSNISEMIVDVDYDTNGVQLPVQTWETLQQKSSVKIVNSKMTVNTECKEQELKRIIANQNRYIERLSHKNTTRVVKEKFIPRWVYLIELIQFPFILLGLLSFVLFLIRTPFLRR